MLEGGDRSPKVKHIDTIDIVLNYLHALYNMWHRDTVRARDRTTGAGSQSVQPVLAQRAAWRTYWSTTLRDHLSQQQAALCTLCIRCGLIIAIRRWRRCLVYRNGQSNLAKAASNLCGKSWLPSNTMFHGSTGVSTPVETSIRSARFA